jgi:hypothetical protein
LRGGKRCGAVYEIDFASRCAKANGGDEGVIGITCAIGGAGGGCGGVVAVCRNTCASGEEIGDRDGGSGGGGVLNGISAEIDGAARQVIELHEVSIQRGTGVAASGIYLRDDDGGG